MPTRTPARSGTPPRARAAAGAGATEAPAAGTDPLAGFSTLTREWFNGAFIEPTAAQASAWASIAGGDNTLVIAPTGSGKTLAAFLWALDRLASGPVPADPKLRCRVLYISPLKALAVDVEPEPARPTGRDPPGRAPPRAARAGHPGGGAHRRHRRRRAAAAV